MRTTLLVSSLLVASCAASVAHAQDGLVANSKDGDDDNAAVRIDDRAIPAEQAALDTFATTWRCTGTSSTDYGADVPTTFTLSGKKDLNGRWLSVRTELVVKAKGAKPIITQEAWGWSRTDGSLVRTGASSDGGIITSTSTGWAGERFAWAGTASQNAKLGKDKIAVEKKSDKVLTVQLSSGEQELRVVFEGTCKR